MGHCFTKANCCRDSYNDVDDDDEDEAFDNEAYLRAYDSRSVHLINTVERWDAKVSEASSDGKILVVNFSAIWCTPCKVIAHTYWELADKYPSVMFVTVDVDNLPELSTTWDIKATPTFFFLKDGKQIDKLVGANKLDLQKKTAAIADHV